MDKLDLVFLPFVYALRITTLFFFLAGRKICHFNDYWSILVRTLRFAGISSFGFSFLPVISFALPYTWYIFFSS
jgi:hypothetical protein